jgi:kynureninase
MGEYTDAEFEKRLNELRDSQKEIQSLSAWLVHHRYKFFHSKRLAAYHSVRRYRCTHSAVKRVARLAEGNSDFVGMSGAL